MGFKTHRSFKNRSEACISSCVVKISAPGIDRYCEKRV